MKKWTEELVKNTKGLADTVKRKRFSFVENVYLAHTHTHTHTHTRKGNKKNGGKYLYLMKAGRRSE